jgi:hypothetical protein
MDLQHVSVKLLLASSGRPGGEVKLDPLIPVFHSWIRDKVCEELLLDVADYQHVVDGPGIVLIGFEGDYSVDHTDHRLGVRYNRKTPLDGSNQDRLKQAARAALLAAQRLESDPRLDGKFRVNGQEIEIFFNDRLLAPNRDATRKAAEPELKIFLRRFFQGADFSLSYGSDPRQLFGVSVRASRPFPLADLLANLNS